MRITLVACVNPQQPAASGVQSYVTTLGRRLAAMGQDVEVLGVGPNHAVIEGIDFVPVAPAARNALEFSVAIWRYLKRWRDSASIVHAHRPDDLIPFHVMKPRTKKVITLHGVHRLHVESRRGRAAAVVYQMGEKYSLKRTHSIICVSSNTKNYFGARYPLLSTRLRVIPAGIDLELFHPRDRRLARSELGIPEDHKVVTYVGRFEPEKNPLSILDEFIAVRNRHDDAHLLLVGDGQLDSELRRRACLTQDSVKILKPMLQERLARLLAESDLVVLASRHEGVPTIALEALASGVPVVGPPVGVLPEVVEEGVNGFLAQAPSDLHLLMEKAMYGSDWAPSACRASVQDYGWDRVAPAILKVYHDIAS